MRLLLPMVSKEMNQVSVEGMDAKVSWGYLVLLTKQEAQLLAVPPLFQLQVSRSVRDLVSAVV